MRTRVVLGSVALAIVTLGCGGSGSDKGDAATGDAMRDGADSADGGAMGDGGDGGDDGDGGSAVGPLSSACAAEVLSLLKTATTYYVAANESGADDGACDGKAASNEGGGHCPWKSLDPVQTRRILEGANVSVVLRAGTYIVKGWDGLAVEGKGASEAERVVLTRYRDEEAVVTVGAPDGAGCPLDPAATQPPACVRQAIRVTGTYVVVQGLVVQDALGYQLEVNGGAHHLIRCNRFRETVDFPMRSDQTKLDGHATDVHFEHNEFTRWRSQAIDITEVDHVYVEGNDFHHPHAKGCGMNGGKKGAHHIYIRGNEAHDFDSERCLQPGTAVTGGGGTGSAHPEEWEASEIHIVGNRISNVKAKLAGFTSCKDCSFEQNDVTNAAAGIIVSASALGLPECSASATGCGASTGFRIEGNRLRGLDGRGDPKQANVFVFVEPDEGAGLTAGANLYCASAADGARFGWNGALVDFAAWTSASGTDSTSTALAASDPRCTSW